MSNVLVVGGLPEPIGGVTSFIYRLAENNYINVIADLYPSEKKERPESYSGEVFFFRSALHFFFWFFRYKKLLKSIDIVHFNFSTPVSLLLPFFLPKRAKQFHLMLHHGSLQSRYPSLLVRLIFKKFNRIYALSSEQYLFYTDIGAPAEKVVRTSSYVPSTIPSIESVDANFLSVFKEVVSDDSYYVISGNCTRAYNHHWAIDLFCRVELNKKLLIFLYGFFDQQYFDLLKLKASVNPRIKIFVNVDAKSFDYALSRCSLYLRPTVKDSFGIAVADAVSFGVPVLASDVCDRYPGVFLFTPSSYQSFKSAYLNLLSNPSALRIAPNNNVIKIFKYTQSG